MSQWTHINGAVRIDSLSNHINIPLGEQFGYENYPKDPDQRNIPYGSEGSLRYSRVITGNNTSLNKVTYVFWGDLRDYDDVDELINYFKTRFSGHMIRSAIIEIDVESQEKVILRFNDNDWRIIKLV